MSSLFVYCLFMVTFIQTLKPYNKRQSVCMFVFCAEPFSLKAEPGSLSSNP